MKTKIIACALAALIFNLITVGAIIDIVRLRGGEIGPSGWKSIFECSVYTFLFLVLAGRYIQWLGSRVLKRLNVGQTRSERGYLSLGYFTGYMTILTVIVVLNILVGVITMANGWAFAIAYILIAFAIWVSAEVFARVSVRG